MSGGFLGSIMERTLESMYNILVDITDIHWYHDCPHCIQVFSMTLIYGLVLFIDTFLIVQ